MNRRLAAIVLSVVVVCSACEETPFPTQPTPVTTTEDFSGTLGPMGANAHPFSVQQAGIMTVTVVTIEPPSTEVTVGIGLGAPSESGCTLQLKNDAALQGVVLAASVTTPGSYCVAIYDGGMVSEEITYTLQLIHP